MKKKIILHTAFNGSGGAEPKAGTVVEMLPSAKKIYCFIRETLFKDLDDGYALHNGSVLTETMSLILASPGYRSCRAQSQLGSTQVAFSKKLWRTP